MHTFKLFMCSFATLLLFSCTKDKLTTDTRTSENNTKSQEIVVNDLISNGGSVGRIIPTKSEIKNIVYEIIVGRGVDYTNITDGSKLIDDLGFETLDITELFSQLEIRLVIKFPFGSSETLNTVGKIVDYIADVLLKVHTAKFTAKSTLELSQFYHDVLPHNLEITYTCELGYLESTSFGNTADVEIVSISKITSSIGRTNSNHVKGTKVQEALNLNPSLQPVSLYDYEIIYTPQPLINSFTPIVDWGGYFNIRVFKAFKCESYQNEYPVFVGQVKNEASFNFTYWNAIDFTESLTPTLNTYLDLIQFTSTAIVTPPDCFNTTNPDPEPEPKRQITAENLRIFLFGTITDYMDNIGRQTNISLNSHFINDLGFTAINMTDDLDFIELIFYIENEIEVEIPDPIVSSFTTVNSVYTYLTTLFEII